MPSLFVHPAADVLRLGVEASSGGVAGQFCKSRLRRRVILCFVQYAEKQ